MRMLPGLLVIVGLLVSPQAGRAEPLKFSATGCGPYTPQEEPLLARYVKMVGDDGQSEFLVHLGDIFTGKRKDWPESQYAKVAGILKQSTIPVFIVPGDNEWNDMNDPDLAWKFWTRHFLHFDQQFKYAPTIARQKVRAENMAWTSKGVLLVGINLVGGRVHDKKEWRTRHQQNADWVKEQFDQRKDDTRAAVVMAQAEPAKDHDSFFHLFAQHAKAYGKPVLYLHADGHVWQVHKGWRKTPNLLRVQTDMVGAAPPVLVTVTDDADNPFVFDRRLAKK